MKIVFFTVLAITCSTVSADYDECMNAIDSARSSADDLASAAQTLASCASNEDFDDDCSSEFYTVQSNHSSYESDASDVEDYCSDVDEEY